ncbi:MAG: two-component system response regulator CreB [Verrucomicrobiota bacterium]
MAAPHILVVEDEPGIAETITYALETEGITHHWVTTGQDALSCSQKKSCDLVLLDIGIPDMSGFDVCRKIRESSRIPIVFLTAREEEIDRVAGLEMGADDYIVKPFSPRELTARIRAILRRIDADPSVSGNIRSSTETYAAASLLVDELKKTIHFHNQPLSLSRYEFRLLAVLVQSPGRVFSRDQLLERAWEEPEASMDRTVDAHIKKLRAKLRQIQPDHDPIVTHRGMGYSLEDS